MNADPTYGKYWTLVDQTSDTSTYEHRLPHGMLVRVHYRNYRNSDAVAEAIVFVPAAPAIEPYR